MPFITGQCRQYFATSSYINYEDIIQECFLTFLDVIRTYNPVRGKLTTALFRPLQHTFINYVAGTHNYSQHANLMVTHYKTLLRENELTGNEAIDYLTSLYNQRYPKIPLLLNHCKIQGLLPHAGNGSDRSKLQRRFNLDSQTATGPYLA